MKISKCSFTKKHNLSILFMLASAVLAGCKATSSSSYYDTSSSPAPSNSIRLAQGYNSLGGPSFSEHLSYCVDTASLESLGSTTGETLTLFVSSASSEVTLQEALSKSLSLGLSYQTPTDSIISNTGKSDGANALSAQMGITSKREKSSIYKSKSVYVVIRARKNFTAESMTQHTIKDTTLDFFAKNPQLFYQKCGDRFISGVIKGAEVSAVFECETESTEKKNKITSEINTKGGYLGIGASASAQQIIDKVRQDTAHKCSMRVASAGGSGNFDGSGPEQFVQSAVAYLASATPSSGVPVEFESMPYDALLNTRLHEEILSKVDLKLESQRAFIESQRSVISALSAQVDRLIGLDQTNPSMIDPLIAGIENSRHLVDQCIRNIYDPSKCRTKEHFTAFKPSK